MAWIVKRGQHSTAAITDQHDRTWVPVAWVAEVFGLRIEIDKAAAAVHLHDQPGVTVPPLPDQPAGAGVEPWLPVDAPIQSKPGERSPQMLDAVIRQFRIATNPRYQPNSQGRGETYCNIFVHDVTRALNAEIPYYLDHNGRPSQSGQGFETDANGMIRWLNRYGVRYGWGEAPLAVTVIAAQAGKPAVVTWFADKAPYIGHMAVMRPGRADSRRGAPIAQAGAKNFDDGFLTDGFGTRGPLQYWVHA